MNAAAYDCPSAQPDMTDARPIGLLSGSPTEVRIAFFKNCLLYTSPSPRD